jgi:hypothetical protein
MTFLANRASYASPNTGGVVGTLGGELVVARNCGRFGLRFRSSKRKPTALTRFLTRTIS